jgi:hypothetical protein
MTYFHVSSAKERTLLGIIGSVAGTFGMAASGVLVDRYTN